MNTTPPLPPLPDPVNEVHPWFGGDAYYTADQMRAYARAALADQAQAEPVAVVGPVWQLMWIGSEPIAHILARHPEIRIGSKLYTAPPPAAQPVAVPDCDVRSYGLRFFDFLKWAASKGHDLAHTYDSDRSRWVALNPMTADLWERWQASAPKD